MPLYPRTKFYKVYTALLSQSGTNAPIATVLNNTIGTIVWTRAGGPGLYEATLAGAFPVDKTVVFITPTGSQDVKAGNNEAGDPSDSVFVQTTLDGQLYLTSIEIRVYT